MSLICNMRIIWSTRSARERFRYGFSASSSSQRLSFGSFTGTDIFDAGNASVFELEIGSGDSKLFVTFLSSLFLSISVFVLTFYFLSPIPIFFISGASVEIMLITCAIDSGSDRTLFNFS